MTSTTDIGTMVFNVLDIGETAENQRGQRQLHFEPMSQ